MDCRYNLLNDYGGHIEREMCGIERRRERCVIVRCVLFHPIVPLFIVVGKVNSLLPLGLQHLIGNLLLIGI